MLGKELNISTSTICRAFTGNSAINKDTPPNLKTIGFASLELPRCYTPRSNITQSAYEMGIKAATLLFEEIENKGQLVNKKERVLKSKLFIRKSSGG